jgi:uncharacterized protein
MNFVTRPPLDVIRRASFKTTPWKNGGGVTHEVAREPDGAEEFRWRVSVAHIEASGPFSEFADYSRTMLLLRGEGVSLHFADGQQKGLRRIGEMIEFDGATPARCELVGGPCVDLNLMVRKTERALASVMRLDSPLDVSATGGKRVLVFAIDGAVDVESDAGTRLQLQTWDMAIVSESGARLRSAAPVAAAVFLATLMR